MSNTQRIIPVRNDFHGDARALTAAAPSPLAERGRIAEVDVIRGAALFGVLWMNLVEITNWLVPPATRDALASAPVDRVVTLLSAWLLSSKAQMLFGILFGFGFAVFTDRALARGARAGTLYARRLTFLLILGTLQYVFLWWGDILHDYALAGFALLLVRRWPDRRVAMVGLALVLLSPLGRPLAQWLMDSGDPHALARIRGQFHHAMWQATASGDYPGMVRAIWLRSAAIYGDGGFVGYFSELFGEFLLGAFLFRTGWLQRAAFERQMFRRTVLICIPAGLALAALDPARSLIGARFTLLPEPLSSVLDQAGDLMLATGYAALIALTLPRPALRPICAGIGALGRMALTNYVSQSVFFFLVIDGFGVGLIGRIGVALGGAAAVILFAAQILLSTWWLRRFRFGPLEWLWRSATYGRWQALRR